jgi:16S rRNA (cytidine1402-2'-O)-methyltransferase
MPGTLYVVATPIGNLEDLSFRALRLLRHVSLITAEDTRRTSTLLRHYDIRTPTTSFHEHNEQQKLPGVVARLLGGEDVALVSDAGTPGVSDPGHRLVRAARAQGIRVETVPGPSAVLAALVTSGLPSDSFTFLGFPPSRPRARHEWLTRLAAEPRTTVFFEAPHRIRITLEAALEVLGEREVVVCRELTKLHEEIIRGPISAILPALGTPRGEMTVVVAPPSDSEKREGTDPGQLWTDDRICVEFGRMTENEGFRRRDAISMLARQLGRSTREIYGIIERLKNGVNDK